MGKSQLWVALWAAGAFGAAAVLDPSARAVAAGAVSTEAQDQAGSETELETVTVVGSRRYGRSSETVTPVPVDVLPMADVAAKSPQFDVAQSLQFIAPSFNSTRQTGADNADLVDSAMLRGLGSDQTLVLLNNKRQHQAAIVNIFGARNRGNTGTDFNTIPPLAIDRIEILRDGAAAQYGSDAIAGVVNVVLKKEAGCEGVVGFGQYSRGDGENTLASSYCGFELDNGGVIALTGEYLKRGRSDRSEPRGSPRTIGDTKMDNRTLFLNGEIPLGDVAHFYFTGGYQDRYASSAAFARGGIGSDDIPSRNSAAMYPNGFVPYINGDLVDHSLIAGVWGEIGGWRADVSQTYGYNELLNDISNTLNASIANEDVILGGPGLSPTKFDAGGYAFTQYTTNVDFSRYLDSVLAGTNVAFGLERRREQYEIFAGERGSWDDYDGAGGGNAGSQGYPGFQPADETDSSRTSWAAYADFEFNWTDRFMTGAAVRFEDYDDFGSTTTGKLTSSFKATDTFLLRGSASTGFRAPSLQQRDFQSTYTEFVGGEPLDILLARNGSAIANEAGVDPLREEEATSFTLGFTWSPLDNLTFTLDGYRIDIDDRVVLSGQFGVDSEAITENLRNQLIAEGVGAAAFFVNAVDTRTTGIDLTIAHNTEVGDGQLTTYFALNHGKTDIRRVNVPAPLLAVPAGAETFLSDRERRFIEDGAPNTKATLTFDYAVGPWDAMFKIIHFGSQTLGSFSGPPVFLNYGAKTSADVSLSYAFTENTKLTLGAANIFDTFPDRQNPDETDNGHVYDSVQFGLNGTSYFARFWVKF
ncbi:TonB-dependent receptor plug domain-containing protein [Tahibacter amnicola]|uniref:TonB-dependent receptor n=1 Tax=Tahibacter amnicola TaxID=2976241 RepID=A0ABY6BE37_9GAMM|nr:TonB-dependent receptor [Tahibacter amnicola]UXI66881.1 TonB-dependent receptor [Tahibacter amnicola]